MAFNMKWYIFILIFISIERSISMSNNSCSSMVCPYPTVCKDGSCICREGFIASNCTQSSDMCFCPDADKCRYGNCSCAEESAFTCGMLPTCDTQFNITCKYNGTCVIKNNRPYCICPPTKIYTTDCTPNRCDDRPCTVGDCIPRDNNDYDCLCPRRGVGKDCDLDRKCTDNFCGRRGTCFEHNYKHAKCRCMDGYYGTQCEETMQFDKCDPLGTESQVTNTTTNDTICTCKVSFKGKSCNLVDCKQQNPCHNNGLCYSDPDVARRFLCLCPPGWTGIDCENDVDECDKFPCTNDGTCINKIGSFMCQCPDNTTGLYCREEGDSCLNRKKCMEVANDGTCNANCNNIHCNFDGGDCILNTDPWDNCKEVNGFCRSMAANGVCNQECNNEACLYDMLDCNTMSDMMCPKSCTDVWGDGQCQPYCNTTACGFDGSDCTEMPENKTIGTLIITFISQSSEAYRTIGRVLSVYSGTIISFNGLQEQSLQQSSKPFGIMAQNSSLQYIAFYTVRNSEDCPSNGTICWNNTNALTKFAAVLFMQNNTIFQDDMKQVIIRRGQACMIGYYGENCDQKCGQCHNSIGCNVTNGYCSDGCVMGYWGNNCKNPCKTCVKGCHMMDGNCTDGACPSGYQGAKCSEECPAGQYGMRCMYNCSINCKFGQCNHVNGECTCVAGHRGSMCQLDCDNGTYGLDCKGECGHCLDNMTCNKIDGSCSMGCVSGYSGKYCHSECVKGKYGKRCSNFCSNCDNDECYPDSGNCKMGCKDGWKGDMCKTAAIKEEGNNSTIIAVIIVMVVLIIVGLGLAIILWRRNQSGDYLLGEKKGPEATSMKDVNRKEPIDKTNDGVEPLIAVTSDDKNSPNAELVIESEGIDLEKEENQPTESERSSKASDSRPDSIHSNKPERSSKASDFRPDSIHGNGPGGVYVGSNQPIGGNIENSASEKTQETPETNGDLNSPKDSDETNPEGTDETTVEDTNETQNEGRSETKENSDIAENKDEVPVTTVNDNGVMNTDKL